MNAIAEAWTFAAANIGAEGIPGLLGSIRKATSERREYGKGKKAVKKAGRDDEVKCVHEEVKKGK
jgi:hypothetical protein